MTTKNERLHFRTSECEPGDWVSTKRDSYYDTQLLAQVVRTTSTTLTALIELEDGNTGRLVTIMRQSGKERGYDRRWYPLLSDPETVRVANRKRVEVKEFARKEAERDTQERNAAIRKANPMPTITAINPHLGIYGSQVVNSRGEEIQLIFTKEPYDLTTVEGDEVVKVHGVRIHPTVYRIDSYDGRTIASNPMTSYAGRDEWEAIYKVLYDYWT